MSWDMEPYNWYQIFGSGLSPFSRGRGLGLGVFREFDEMQREMEMMFGDIQGIEKSAPKELEREYETVDGAKVREV